MLQNIMARGHFIRRNARLWLVLVTSISTLFQFIALSLQKRRRFRAMHLSINNFSQDRPSEGRQSLLFRLILLKQLSCCVALLSDIACSPPRSIECPWYIKPRVTEWQYLFIDWTPEEDLERFRQFFRVSPAMFRDICNLVREDMMTEPPKTLICLPNRVLVVERQVAVAIRRLATGDQLLGISELFGISSASASKVTWKFIQSFSLRARHYLTWPVGRDMEEVKAGFNDRWGFPNCCGAIDCTHFVIELPVGEQASAYFDWKHNLSITMQAVVDSECRFLDVLIGNPGSTADARLLRLSGLYQDVIYNGTKLNGPSVRTRHGYLGEYLLGDGGYPLYKWLIVPFPKNQTMETDRWNTAHSSARMCVERSFGRLKGVWRILSRLILRPKLERLAPTILCSVLLHNMMVSRGEEILAAQYGDIPAHPMGYGSQQRPANAFFDGGERARGILFREILRQDG